MEHDADMILPNLWLGNKKASQDEEFLKRNNIKYILSVIDESPNIKNNTMHHWIKIKDAEVCDDKFKNEMLLQIDNAVNFINLGLSNNCGVLVHCKRGHHRSANMIVMFMMKYLNIGYLPAIIYINKIRPTAMVRKTCVNKWVLHYYSQFLIK